MPNAENKAWYAAFRAKDSRFDGRFFVGVSSTGIYCRPVCRARLPKEENCTFYKTATEAEQAGYRPCLICRPELAPGTSITDATGALVRRATRFLEQNCGSGQSIEELANRLGYSDRHLRRVFTEEYHVTPVQYLQTCRLLLAKNLLTDTNLTVLDVAMTSGFGSLRRFNDLFKKQYRMSPTDLRKNLANPKKQNKITVALGYRPPYQWQDFLNFLSGRAIPGVEVVANGKYYRTIRQIDRKGECVYGWIKVENAPQKNVLTVTLSESLLPVLPQVLAAIKSLFDLYCEPDAVYEVLADMNKIRPGLCVLGTRIPGSIDPFEVSVRAVLGQQITVKAASTLAGRLVKNYGQPIQTEIEGLTHTFPTASDMLALKEPIESELGSLGIISSRARTILALAHLFEEKQIDFELCAEPEKEVKKLMTIPGIGVWTANYIAMRALGWTDAFLETDYGIKKALPGLKPKEMLARAEKWRPWRSYATINLWNSL